MAALGHNGGPGAAHLAQLLQAAERVEAQIAQVMHGGAREASRQVDRFTRGAPWLFFPSRLAKCPRDRKALEGARRSAGDAALAKREGQLAQLERKLARIEAAIAAARDGR